MLVCSLLLRPVIASKHPRFFAAQEHCDAQLESVRAQFAEIKEVSHNHETAELVPVHGPACET